MATHFITVLNGVITGQHSGDINVNFFGTPYHGHERLAIPPKARVSVFDKLEFYDKNWKRKNNFQLIKENLLPMPKGYVKEDDDLRLMTAEERIITGLDNPPWGHKIANGKITEMTQIERINFGLEELQAGYKIVGNDIVEMALEEKIETGIEELPLGFKVKNGEFVEMSPKEKIAAGVLTQEEYNKQIEAMNTGKLQNQLAELQTPEVLAQAEIDDEFAAERKIKLIALLAVKKQEGWPLEVKWPNE
jgi:hypothetical protein